MKLCCVVVTVFFGTDAILRVTAGTSPEQAQDPTRWLTLNPIEDDPAAIVVGILAKLTDALEKGGDGIDVTANGRIIVKTPRSIPSTAMEKRGNEKDVPAARSMATREPLINLNTATLLELRSLPGVGPVIARKIVAGRPYRAAEDLMNVDGIGNDKMAGIKPLVRVE